MGEVSSALMEDRAMERGLGVGIGEEGEGLEKCLKV